jgi:hypothetical protein
MEYFIFIYLSIYLFEEACVVEPPLGGITKDKRVVGRPQLGEPWKEGPD